MVKILLLSDLTRGAERELIMGISKYGNKLGGWTFFHGPHYLTQKREDIPEVFDRAKQLNADVIFGQWPVLDEFHAVQSTIPIFLRQRQIEEKGITHLFSNHASIGQMAAEYFLKQGFTHCAFSGYSGLSWVKSRAESFKKVAGKFFCGEIFFKNEHSDWKHISNWLKKLPRPVAILGCNDTNARTIIGICQSIGLSVPDDVAVLGVDNDIFTCMITSPTISTISLDYEQWGYRVGQIIHNTINNGSTPPQVILNEPLGIIERQSTKPKVVDPYAAEIIRYMHDNYSEGIGIQDAIDNIPLSRRSIEQHFKKEFGKSMLQMLIDMKLENMKYLLATTDLSIDETAFRSGFSKNENIYRLFKIKLGCTPSEYRREALSHSEKSTFK